jgi:PAS domain S-box-containing protein
VGAIVANYRDVTERKQADEALRRERDLVMRIMNTSPVSITLVDRQGAIVYANPRAEQVLGLDKTELAQLSYNAPRWRITDYEGGPFPEADLPFPTVMATGQPVYDVRHAIEWPNGRRVLLSVNAAPVHGEEGEIDGMVAAIEDVTEQVQAERARARLAAIVESSDDAILGKSLDGTIVSWNDGAARLYGYTAEEAIGRSVSMLAPPERVDEMASILERLVRGERVQRLETVRVRRDGQLIDVSVTISPIRDHTSKIVGAASIARDITQRKQHELALRKKNEELVAMTQQLWHAAKLATLGELAASIAHELNNPLATITLRLEAMLSKLPADAAERPALAIIEGEAARMARLVAELLVFGRRGQPQRSTLDLREELDRALEFMDHHIHQKRIEVTRAYEPRVLLVHADRQLLRQVFLNLLTNACDAMPQGGALTLRVGEGRLHGGSAVMVELVDSGEGISPANLAEIWEPFFTTKAEGQGTGLGLAICRRILQEHGGSISLDSDLGQGTAVRLLLPFSGDDLALHPLQAGAASDTNEFSGGTA